MERVLPRTLTTDPQQTFWQKITQHKVFRFLAIGLVACTLSLLVYYWLLTGPEKLWQASFARWLVLLVVNYLGYSRWMLLDVLEADQARLGRLRAEWRMMGRTLAAVGASNLAKVPIEPLMASWIIDTFGMKYVMLAPLTGDFFYGPIINFIVLMLLSKVKQPDTHSEHDQGTTMDRQ